MASAGRDRIRPILTAPIGPVAPTLRMFQSEVLSSRNTGLVSRKKAGTIKRVDDRPTKSSMPESSSSPNRSPNEPYTWS